MKSTQILDALFHRDRQNEYRRDPRFRQGITDTLAKVLRAEIAEHPDTDPNEIIDHVMTKVYREWKDIITLPKGPNRARIIHMRMDKAIAGGKRRHSEEFANLACKAKCSGCCYTNISITTEEAELLAEHVRAGLPIDRERLALQAEVGESDFEKWRTTPFEQRACVFLAEDGDCRVYEDRPGVCRKWFAPKPHAPASCTDLRFNGQYIFVHGAEVINSALFNLEYSQTGRLAKKVQDALEAKKETNGTEK